MPNKPTKSWWAFPPSTREIQFDERWSFVGKKEARCDREDPDDDARGDCWDHVALDAESRLVLALVPGKRTAQNTEQLIAQAHRRTGGRTDLLLTSDGYTAYPEAIAATYGRPVEDASGTVIARRLPRDLCYATVTKRRQGGRVVEVVRAVVFGTWALLALWLGRSRVSSTVNTAFVERKNGTDRRKNGRQHRKTYGFSKDPKAHAALSYFVTYSSNFCWPVRTLRERREDGTWRPRTPAMVAGLANQVWSLQQWLTYPVLTC